MSLRVVSLASLLFFSGFVTAAITAPDCTNATMLWANTIGQNPCTIAAYLLSTCSGGSFTVPPLPQGYRYTGPKDDQKGDLCLCNTVTYSLISACGACQQGAGWLSYSKFVSNCTTVLAPKTFPNPVPDGTRVPIWALIDIVDGTWDITRARIGNDPETYPGTKIGG